MMPPRSELVPDQYKSQPITLLVGSTPYTEFYVHSDILNSKTTYWFTQTTELPPKGGDLSWYWVPADTLYLDDDPATVGLFLEFIYSRPPSYTVPGSRPRIFIDTQLYCFGAKYAVEELVKYAIHEIHKYLASAKSEELQLSQRLQLIERSYAQTTNEKDRLRKLLARDFARQWEKHKKDLWKDDEIDFNTKVGRMLLVVPDFQKNLLAYLGNSQGDRLQAPNGVA